MADKKIQILVVEDDEVDRFAFTKELRDFNIPYELTFAIDHQSGLEATHGKEYDCIFLDYNLPGGTGLELLAEIRKTDKISPIFVVTSHGDEKIAVKAIQLGANDYIPKEYLKKEGIAQSVRFMLTLKEGTIRQAELERRLRETQEQLNTVVSNAPIILFSLDQEGRFKLFEGKGLETLSIQKEQILDQTISQQTDLPIKVDDFQKTVQGVEHTSVIEWNGKFFELFYSPIRSSESEITGVLGIASDITIHKNAERELKKAKQLAEETAKIKEQFLANMSHEIRTPMNGIIGLTRILLKTKLSEEQLHYMESISACSDNLLIIINDILDFSKIEAGKMNFESVPFSIEKISQQTIDLFQLKADEKSLQLIFEKDKNVPKNVLGDPTRLSQILNNLISNAIKFTEKGEVRLIIRSVPQADGETKILFEVKDSGIGIPEKSISSIFESFTQASSDTTRKFGGTGLGLTIVKKMVELQNGTLSVKSKSGSGTTFSFELPFTINNDHQENEIYSHNDINDISHLRVLIAEDNKVNQMIVKKVFSDWKVKTDIADNGAIAVEMLKNNYYDVVLMDIQMPEMDGYTAVHMIRLTLPDEKRSTPVMAMTAHATLSEKEKCINAGMDDYISKPFNPDDLKSKIVALTKFATSTLKENRQHTAEEDFTKVTLQSENINQPGKQSADPTGKINYPSIETDNQTSKINLTYLKKIAEGNQAFLIEMIEMFLNKTPSALDEMKECFNKKNWEEMRKIAHRIKPSFAYVGLSEIQASLTKVENWEQENDAAEVNDLLTAIKNSSSSAFDELRKELITLR